MSRWVCAPDSLIGGSLCKKYLVSKIFPKTVPQKYFVYMCVCVDFMFKRDKLLVTPLP